MSTSSRNNMRPRRREIGTLRQNPAAGRVTGRAAPNLQTNIARTAPIAAFPAFGRFFLIRATAYAATAYAFCVTEIRNSRSPSATSGTTLRHHVVGEGGWGTHRTKRLPLRGGCPMYRTGGVGHRKSEINASLNFPFHKNHIKFPRRSRYERKSANSRAAGLGL